MVFFYLLAVNYFRKKAPSQMFHRVLSPRLLTKLFDNGGPYHLETSPLICRAIWLLYDRDLHHETVKAKW